MVKGVNRARLVYITAAAYLAGGLFTYIAWQISGKILWLDFFFRVPGSLAMVALSAAQVILSARVCSEFAPGEPLYSAWRLVTFSAACDLVGSLCVQVFSAGVPWNPLARLPGWSSRWEDSIRQIGLTSGGPLRFALMAAGLFYVVQIYRRSGFLGRYKPRDYVALLLAILYVGREFLDLWKALQAGKRPEIGELLSWPVDPLLCLLLAEALLLYRSTQRMGPGWIGRCWMAFSAGVAFVVLGNALNWGLAYGLIPRPMWSIEWYVWVPASAAFAVAPIYQMDVIRRASSLTPIR